MDLMIKHKKHFKLSDSEVLSDHRELILFNDDVNTFDFIIKSLIEVCGHEHHQAQQCALIAHCKGKCAVKKGFLDDLKIMYSALSEKGITVEISSL